MPCPALAVSIDKDACPPEPIGISLPFGSQVVHPPHGLPRPIPAIEPERPAPAPAAPSTQAPVSRKLTKAERKALRKRLQQMAAERQRREMNR